MSARLGWLRDCRVCRASGRMLFRLVESADWTEIDCPRCCGLGVVMR